MRRAPVQKNKTLGKPTGTVPWEVHERAAKVYNDLGFNQSAERLAERHGLCYGEMQCLLAGHYEEGPGCASHEPIPGWEPNEGAC